MSATSTHVNSGKRKYIGFDVFQTALNRTLELYEQGHRVVVAFSGGKDSTCILELALIAAEMTGNLPVEVLMRDEEIMFPGTFEYCERVAAREDLNFHWISCRQPLVNVYNREMPYFWIFDPELDPSEWVRQPPSFIEWLPDINMYHLISKNRFPPPEGKELIQLVGLRASESLTRLLGIHTQKGYAGAYNEKWGFRKAHVIYDWKDGDVWKAISENNWDYNHAYDVMLKMGMPARKQRIAPPTMTWFGADAMQMSAKAWPHWFDKVAKRCPGVRNVVHYGKRAISPIRRTGETWEECCMRECVHEAPEWIAERTQLVLDRLLSSHTNHSTSPFPQVEPCKQCGGAGTGSWKRIAQAMFFGDPFSLKMTFLPYVQPNVFRPHDTRTWGDGPPSFS